MHNGLRTDWERGEEVEGQSTAPVCLTAVLLKELQLGLGQSHQQH